MKTAVITGITGQDGAYLADFLLGKGYKVIGAFRRTSARNFWRLRDLGLLENPKLDLVEHDLTDLSSSIKLVGQGNADEIYNLAAQSFVGVSFDQPSTTAQITALGTLNLLEAVRIASPSSRFYQASTSEMFGQVQTVPQNELTNFYPRSPYGVSKLFAHWTSVNYRESYGLFTASGILFNHESPLRGREFVTRKITCSVARIALGAEEVLELGNLSAERDWGYAAEYVEGMWKMLQIEEPLTLVLATGKKTTVRDFVRLAFLAAGMEINFEGEGEKEVARLASTGKVVVRVNPKYYRPAEVELLLGDYSLAKSKLGWSPTTNVEQLSQIMIKSDIEKLQAGRHED